MSPQMLTVTAIALCTYLGFGMVTVVLPHFVTSRFHGSTLAVGIVVGIYSFAAVLARPWAGRLGNQRGRRWLMIAGAIIIAGSFLLDAIAPNLAVLMALRLVTGTGEGMFYIGSATLVTDLVPSARRAEAIGYYSVALYLGSGVGPTIGHLLAQRAGIPAVFVTAAGLSLLGTVASVRLPNPKPEAVPQGRQNLVNRAAVLPGAVLFLGIMGLIPFQAYVPLYTDQLHMSGPQYVFLLYSAVICLVRLLGSRIHRVSPRRIATIAILLIIVGLALMASVASPISLYLGVAVFGAGVAIQFPALMGIALSRASDQERAAVVGTYTAFMDLAQGVGGFLLGVPAALAGYRASFATGSVFAMGALALLRVSGAGKPASRSDQEPVGATHVEAKDAGTARA
jgi:MFS family permease